MTTGGTIGRTIDGTIGGTGDPDVGAPTLPELRMAYRGRATELFSVAIKNVFLTLLTLGVYAPWARAERRRYMWNQVEVDGQRLDYTGTGKELFLGYLKVIAGYLVLIGLPRLVGLASKGLGGALQLFGGVTILVLIPHAIYWSRRYLLSRTRWRGIHFGLAGDASAFAKLWVWGSFLTVVTLGLFGPVLANRVYATLINHTRYGDASFSYDGRDREAFRIGIKGLLLSIITLGIYWFWYQARLQRFRLSHTRLDRAVGTIDLTGGLLLKLTLINVFGTLLTLGLASPWTVTYSLRQVLGRIRFVGAIDFDRIGQRPVSGNAAGDTLAGALGVELGI